MIVCPVSCLVLYLNINSARLNLTHQVNERGEIEYTVIISGIFYSQVTTGIIKPCMTL